jgi:hypothetical protein
MILIIRMLKKSPRAGKRIQITFLECIVCVMESVFYGR